MILLIYSTESVSLPELASPNWPESNSSGREVEVATLRRDARPLAAKLAAQDPTATATLEHWQWVTNRLVMQVG